MITAADDDPDDYDGGGKESDDDVRAGLFIYAFLFVHGNPQ